MRSRSLRCMSTTAPRATRPRRACACLSGSIACTSRWMDNAARNACCKSPLDTRPMRPCGSVTTSTPGGSSSNERKPRHRDSRSHLPVERRLRLHAGAHARSARRQIREIHDGGQISREQRASLDRGLTQLRAGEYDTAVRSLRQAMWDVEQIDQPSLRLEELVEVHQTLAAAYAGLGKNQWSEEQRALAQALVEYGRRENGSGSPETALAKAKSAYQAAHFREAVTAFGQALVELEGLSPTPVRLKSLVDARCHLVLAYFALGRSDRAGEEV